MLVESSVARGLVDEVLPTRCAQGNSSAVKLEGAITMILIYPKDVSGAARCVLRSGVRRESLPAVIREGRS